MASKRVDRRKHFLWTPDNWDDGYICKGRMTVYRPDYPCCTPHGYVSRSRIVWWLVTGEVVRKGKVVHHINGDKMDDRFENL